MTPTLASAVSLRVETLIDQHHRGNRVAAATGLGVEPDQLAGLLSGDWRRFSLDALAALVRGYGVSVAWLLSPLGDGPNGAARHHGRTHAGEPRTTRPHDG